MSTRGELKKFGAAILMAVLPLSAPFSSADECKPSSAPELTLSGALQTLYYLGPTQASPGRWLHLQCIKQLGGCPGTVEAPDAGLVENKDIANYDSSCRAKSRFQGAGIAEHEMLPACSAPPDWASRNQSTIELLRKESGGNDAEALARMFEDPRIFDDHTLAGRLDVVLTATEHPLVTGARTGIEFSDVGFKEEYRDPHPESRNQVGHFLTAVGLGFDPGQVERGFSVMPKLGLLDETTGFTTVPMRTLLAAPFSMSSEEVALRLIVGHEKAPDPKNAADPYTKWQAFKKQFHLASESELTTFLQAGASLGDSAQIDMKNAEKHLKRIEIHPEYEGNSINDLKLSLAGWELGRLIRAGKLRTPADAAKWLRTNISASK